jgi:hypothetical protein
MLDTSEMDLRALARAYSGGLLDFKQYRRARAQLLDNVTEDATIMVQPHSGSVSPVAGQRSIEPGVTKRESYRAILLSLLVMCVLLILVFWLVMD